MINGKKFALVLVIVLLGIMVSLQTVFAQDLNASEEITIEVCMEPDLECFYASATTFGASQSGTTHTGGGGGAGKVDVEDITLVKKIDKNTPKIFILLAKGDNIPQAEIKYRKIADRGQGFNFMTITLTNVLITQLQTVSASSQYPSESVSLNFAEVCVAVREISESCRIGPEIRECFDIEENVPK